MFFDFKRPVTLPTWAFSVLKMAMISFGILVGARFAPFWTPLAPIILFVLVASWAWASWLWWDAYVKAEPKSKKVKSTR